MTKIADVFLTINKSNDLYQKLKSRMELSILGKLPSLLSREEDCGGKDMNIPFFVLFSSQGSQKMRYNHESQSKRLRILINRLQDQLQLPNLSYANYNIRIK